MSTVDVGFVVLDFIAQWCPPCKALTPIIEAVAKEHGVRLLAIDVDEQQALAARYNVRAMPTVVFVRDGADVGRFVGLRSKAFVSEALNQALRL